MPKNYKTKYALDWMNKYDPKTETKYWYYKDRFVPVLEPIDTDDNFSYTDLSVITGKSASELKSTLEDEISANLYSSTV